MDAPSWYTDLDGDGFGDDATEVVTCDQPSEAVSEGGDCNDLDAGVHPDATELVGNEVDDDCDGEEICYVDSDGDGHANEDESILLTDGLECSAANGLANDEVEKDDCNDAVASIHPGADEYCNSIDDDCDGATDEIDAVDVLSWYTDADGDGYGTGLQAQPSCETINGKASNNDDCNDGDAAINPGANEVCGDGIDNDCEGSVDGNDAIDTVEWFLDSDGDGDGDGYGNPSLSNGLSCQGSAGTVTDKTDCDDTDATVHPNASEICDGIDNDCDNAMPSNETDTDGDLYVACTVDSGGWDSTALQINGGDDCDDGNASIHPGASEHCDGTDPESVDYNCDGDPELGADNGTTFYADTDGDLYGDTNIATVMCNLPTGYVAELGDCDDTDNTVNPSAAEICDGLDNDCDTVLPTNESDADGDLYVECTLDAGGWDGAAFSALGGDDCDDSTSRVSPGNTEDCDGVDTDCDGTTPSDELDGDGDGYVECSWSSLGNNGWLGPSPPTAGGDCDDGEFDIHPGAQEHCGPIDSLIDYNCDGDLQAGASEGSTYYEDSDVDGLINPSSTETFCDDPASGWLSAGVTD